MNDELLLSAFKKILGDDTAFLCFGDGDRLEIESSISRLSFDEQMAFINEARRSRQLNASLVGLLAREP